MAGEIEDRGEAQVHWLVAGQFGLGARGKTLTLTRADFNEALEKRGLSVQASIPDAVGTGDTISVTLQIDSLKALTLKHVVSAVPALTALSQKAEKLAGLKSPTVDEVKKILGEGKLFDAARAVLEGGEAPAAPSGGEVTGDPDAIFEKAAVQEKTAKSAISMFVKATSSTQKKAKPGARQLRDLVEEATWAMARDVLASPEVQAVEATWRGVRFLVTQCPKDAQMEVVLLETDLEHVVEDVASRERGEDIDEPECIFVPFEVDSTAPLADLADLAESELIPVVVGVSPKLFGGSHPQEIPDAFEALEHARNEELPEWAVTWDELRMRESTRWLCAVANRVALHTEGSGAAARTCFGSGVWGLATLLARSYGATGGFAHIFGKTGSVSAPATHTIKGGRYADTATPTEAFYAIAPTEVLAKNGILGMGSAKNSDALVLAKAPCVRGAKDVVPLPAQILTGRIVRFATWVKAQLPEGCNSATANDIFMSASSVFLFPGQQEWAHVRAAVTNIAGEAHVVVHARANPKVASIPLDISFPLALSWSVPAPTDDGPSTAPKPSAGAAASVKAQKDPSKDEGGIASVGLGFDVGLDKKK